MSFHEKSAWVMSAVLTLVGALYLGQFVNDSANLGQWAAPSVGSMIGYAILLVVMAIIGHVVMAIANYRDVSDTVDEREQKIQHKAQWFAGHILVGFIVLALLAFLVWHNGDLLFHSVLLGLILSQISFYIAKIIFTRSVW